MEDSAHNQGEALEDLKGVGALGLVGPAGGKSLEDLERITASGGIIEDVTDASAHVLGKDSWYEAGFHLVSGLDNAAILAYPFVLAQLGWPGGVIAWVLGGVISFYCNALMCKATCTATKRFVRFRDLSYAMLGRPGWWTTVILQYGNLCAGNIALNILCGESLQSIYAAYDDNMSIKLADWSAISGFCFWVLAAAIPSFHYLRPFSAMSILLVLMFVFITIGTAAKDGKNNGPQDYSLKGPSIDKFFFACNSLGTIAFAFNTVILPEISATVRKPPYRNMLRALGIEYGLGATLFVVLAIVGFWAYGNDVEPFLILNISGPSWALTWANVAIVLQVIISYNIFAQPIYEALDYKFCKLDQSIWSIWNILARCLSRAVYAAFTAFFAALLPFFNDFLALIGALSVVPLDGIFPILFHLKQQRGKLSVASLVFHWTLAVLLSFVCVLSTISSIRSIIVDAQTYSVFANL